jgi:hypothetical protein
MNPEQLLQKTVEGQANSSENSSQLLFSRLANPVIRNQIINLLYQAELWAEKNVTYNEPITGENGVWVRDTNGDITFNIIPHIARTKEEIEKDYDKTFERITHFTEIGFGPDQPHGGDADDNEKVFLGWKLPSGQAPNTKQWSIIEAHEKGHSIRQYCGPTQKLSIGEEPKNFFREYFSPAFDPSAIIFSDDDYQQVRKVLEQEGDKEVLTFEEQKEEFFNYIFSGQEIAERMSQLKNYFGFKGNEEFTIEHLRYAKEHYVQDIGFDNRMTPFLNAITVETEGEFIRLVNCSGI